MCESSPFSGARLHHVAGIVRNIEVLLSHAFFDAIISLHAKQQKRERPFPRPERGKKDRAKRFATTFRNAPARIQIASFRFASTAASDWRWRMTRSSRQRIVGPVPLPTESGSERKRTSCREARAVTKKKKIEKNFSFAVKMLKCDTKICKD